MIQLQENARRNGRTDGRMDRPYFIGPFRLTPRVQQKTKKLLKTAEKFGEANTEIVK